MDTPTSKSFHLRHMILLAGQWFAVASLFVVPINKPATNVAIGLSILCALLGSGLKARWQTAWSSPVARGALVWWCVLSLSVLHARYLSGGWPHLGSALWACLYPMAFAALLQTDAWRKRALLAFVAAMVLILFLSYAFDFGWLSHHAIARTAPDMRGTVFKEYTQQGLATLVLGCMALAWSIASPSRWTKAGFVLIALLALANVTMVLQSRTSYLVLAPLLLFWGYRLLRTSNLKGWQLAMIGVIAVAAAVVVWKDSPIHERLVVSISKEVTQYEQTGQPTSTGIRLELWQRTVSIIESAPWLGHGYGQWLPIYRHEIMGLPQYSGFIEGHPHQEMLLIASEQGLLGLAIYLLLLAALLRYIVRLAQPERDIYACLLLIYFVAGLGNCLWADFSHRHLFILLLACIPTLVKRPQALPKPTIHPELAA